MTTISLVRIYFCSLFSELKNDVDDISKATDFVPRCVQRINEITLLSRLFWMQPDFIDGMMIGYEWLEEHLPQVEDDRIKKMELLHKKVIIVSKVNEDSPLL